MIDADNPMKANDRRIQAGGTDYNPFKQPPKPIFTKVEEQNRTYTFPNGSVTIQNVVSINVSKSGTHRINTKDGGKHIIPPGWIHIQFTAPEWTF
jgi:hypothetical protein